MNANRSAQPRPRGGLRGYRGPLAILLTLLLPPLGILVIWRLQIYKLRARMLLTAVGTAVMVLFVCSLRQPADVVNAAPVAGSTELFTEAPKSDVLTALSSLEEIARAQVPESENTDSTVIQVSQENQIAAQQALLDTVVYSVYHNAKYYHGAEDCEGQHNSRQLTIRDALKEGLAPCPECNPPMYEAISYDTPVIEPANVGTEGEAEADVEFGADTGESNTFPDVF
ncbi:MAG: hypothetical protein E7317_00820 [Clostridiales bacterium]|nr:hypothetical protein [Clostridiales bacterium]